MEANKLYSSNTVYWREDSKRIQLRPKEYIAKNI